MDRLATFWTWLTDSHTVFTTPEVDRRFLRCDSCGRTVMHYWVCKPVGEPGRAGCPCGGIHVRTAHIPEWKAAWFVLSRLVVRKWLLGKPYWDPRMPERRRTPDA